jgi:aminopeptidase
VTGENDPKRPQKPAAKKAERPVTARPVKTPRPTSRPPSSSSLRLPDVDFELVNAARRITEGALGLAPGEHIVIVIDRARHDLGMTLYEVARLMKARATLVMLEDLGTRPLRHIPEKLNAVLAEAQASVLLAGFEEGEQGMRVELVVELVRRLNLRHAHMIGVTRQSMLSGFSVDPTRVLDATRAVRMRLRPDSVLRLRTAAGSDLEVKLSPAHRWMEHVGVIRPGRWENLPSGELVTTPATVSGVYVADASMGGHFGQAAGLLAGKPVRLEVEGGVFKGARCADVALQLEVERFLKAEHNGDRVGAIGLGTNVGIHDAIGDVSCDQNMPGLTLGFGSTFADQTGASWNARTQITFTCSQADVDLDGAPLVRRGRYILS